MSVLEREALEQSPLADLHALASELSIDGYRLLRREQLVDAILARQDGAAGPAHAPAEETKPEPKPRRRRGRRGGGSRASAEESSAEPAVADQEPSAPEPAEPAPQADEAPKDTGRRADREGEEAAAPAGSERARFEALEARFPDEQLTFGSEAPIVAAIESLAPIGKGSRVTIVGPARVGKTHTLRRLSELLAERDDLELLPVLVGVRPEEIPEWTAGPVKPLESLSLASPPSAQDRAVYGAIDRARSIALAGGHAVVLLDTLDGLHEHATRRVLATARRLLDGGSVTLIATSSEPIGGETTVIALAPSEQGPALDLRLSGTLRAELLVGEEGAAAIVRAQSEALRR